ncbi:MAG: hypothetical protein AABY15_00905 [Nanoarchaeota archaeon]
MRVSKWLHFRKKTKIIQWKTWDVEFLKFQLKSLREDVRLQYDNIKEQKIKNDTIKELIQYVGIDEAKKRISLGPDALFNIDKSTKLSLNENEKQQVKDFEIISQNMQTDLTQLEQRMIVIDKQIEEAETNLENFYSLLKMLKLYISHDKK